MQIALDRHNISAQIYCILQFGYFKAVKLFFRLTWDEADQATISFIIQQYFENQDFELQPISKYEHYSQCKIITTMYGYRSWAKSHEEILYTYAEKLIRRDMNQKFIAIELLDYLQTQKIIRPGYTTLQTIVSTIINNEYGRLSEVMDTLTAEDIIVLNNLIAEDDTLSKLAALKQDAKDFKSRMMLAERRKLETLHPIYQIIKRLRPILRLSQQNLNYYAELVNYYTIYELRKMLKPELTYLYLMCYCWKRFRQVSDNLVSAFTFFLKQIEDEINILSNHRLTEHVMSQREEFMAMKRLAQLYVDDKISDETNFGLVRKKAFEILPREQLLNKVSNLDKPPIPDENYYWQAADVFKRRVTQNLRPLVAALSFSSVTTENQWISALDLIKSDHLQPRKLAPLLDEYPDKTIPPRLLPYLTSKTIDHPNVMVNQSRYEFWIYQQLNNQLKNGSIFLEDSLLHRSLNHELVPVEEIGSLSSWIFRY